MNGWEGWRWMLRTRACVSVCVWACVCACGREEGVLDGKNGMICDTFKFTILTPNSLCSSPPRINETHTHTHLHTHAHWGHSCIVNQVWSVKAACLGCQSGAFECQMSVLSVRMSRCVCGVCVHVCVGGVCVCLFDSNWLIGVCHYRGFGAPSLQITAWLSPVRRAELALFISVLV